MAAGPACRPGPDVADRRRHPAGRALVLVRTSADSVGQRLAQIDHSGAGDACPPRGARRRRPAARQALPCPTGLRGASGRAGRRRRHIRMANRTPDASAAGIPAVRSSRSLSPDSHDSAAGASEEHLLGSPVAGSNAARPRRPTKRQRALADPLGLGRVLARQPARLRETAMPPRRRPSSDALLCRCPPRVDSPPAGACRSDQRRSRTICFRPDPVETLQGQRRMRDPVRAAQLRHRPNHHRPAWAGRRRHLGGRGAPDAESASPKGSRREDRMARTPWPRSGTSRAPAFRIPRSRAGVGRRAPGDQRRAAPMVASRASCARARSPNSRATARRR